MADDSGYNWAQIIGPLIQGGSQLLGQQQGIDASNQQNQLLKDAYQRALAMLSGGQLDVGFNNVGAIGPSEMNGVQADPQSIMAQREALNRLNAASQEGYGVIDKAAINRTMNEANANERGQREAALARLDPNSGAAMAARMGAQQSSANRANQQALDIAANSRKHALNALGQYGSLASGMRGQSFNEGAARAQANDAISKFNAETSRFNATGQMGARQNSIMNQLKALGLASGEGSALGQGLYHTGKLQGQQTATGGQVLGGAVNAFTSKNGSGGSGTNETGSTDTPSSGYYDQPAGPVYDPDYFKNEEDQ